MNTNSRFVALMLVVGSLFVAQVTRAEDIYNNSSNRLAPNYFAQTTGYEFGDEIIAYATNSYGYRFITNFVFEYFGTGFSGDETAQLRIYANDGPVYGTNNGVPYYEPGTMLYDSGAFAISDTAGSTLAFKDTLLDDGSTYYTKKGLWVPSNFTWTVEFAGVTGGESAGLAMYGPPSVGSDYADYWERNLGTWSLRNSTNWIGFGAYVEASVDEKAPSCSVYSPVDKYRSSSNTLDIVGKAADASGIPLVLYRIGHPLYGTNNFAPMGGTNTPYWTVTGVPLQPGTNYFDVKSVDGSGNESKLVTRKFVFVVSNALTLIKIGSGTLIPDLTGASLEINRDYTMTAYPTVSDPPGPNYVFSNWLSSIEVGVTNIETDSTKLRFRMQTNLVLVADFETNRFVAGAGWWYGLFSDEDTPLIAHERSGLFQLKTTSKRKFSGKIYVDGNVRGFAGYLNLAGDGTSKEIKRRGKSSMFVNIHVTFDGSDTCSGTLYTTSNTPYAPESPNGFTSAMSGYKVTWDEVSNPATNYYGTYTLAVDRPADSALPQGHGYASVRVKDYNGKVVCVGKLGDYIPLKAVVVKISKDGDWPFMVNAYPGWFDYIDPKTASPKTYKENKGMMLGWMKFTNNTAYAGSPGTNDSGRELFDGSVNWIKTPDTNFVKKPYDLFYQEGFTNFDLTVWGSAWFAPTNAKVEPAIPITEGNLQFIAGDLPFTISNNFMFTTNNKVKIYEPNIANSRANLSTKLGTLSGKFYHSNDLVSPKRVPKGAFLQDDNIGYGVFYGTNTCGYMLFQSN